MRLAGDRAGSVMIEAAAVIPLLVFLMVGIFDVSRYFLAVNIVSEVAMAASLEGVDPSVGDTWVIQSGLDRAVAMGVSGVTVSVDGRSDGGDFTVTASLPVHLFVIFGGDLDAKANRSAFLRY